MEYILGLIVLGVLILSFMIYSLTKQNRRKLIREQDEFVGVIDVRRKNKERLRTDDEYRNKLHDKYND